jgi:hypothetical protein
VNADAFGGKVIYRYEDCRLTFPGRDRCCHVSAPNFIRACGGNSAIMCLGPMAMPHSLWSLQAMFSHQPTRAFLGCTNALESQFRPDFAVTLPIKGTLNKNGSNVFNQLFI